MFSSKVKDEMELKKEQTVRANPVILLLYLSLLVYLRKASFRVWTNWTTKSCKNPPFPRFQKNDTGLRVHFLCRAVSSQDGFFAPTERELKLRQIKADKEERRREKEAEAKKQLSIQKQASFMELFFKSKHSNDLENQVDQYPKFVMPSDSFGMNFSMMGSTTVQMDSALSQQDSFDI